jgi:hypothetical protein
MVLSITHPVSLIIYPGISDVNLGIRENMRYFLKFPKKRSLNIVKY